MSGLIKKLMIKRKEVTEYHRLQVSQRKRHQWTHEQWSRIRGSHRGETEYLNNRDKLKTTKGYFTSSSPFG